MPGTLSLYPCCFSVPPLFLGVCVCEVHTLSAFGCSVEGGTGCSSVLDHASGPLLTPISSLNSGGVGGCGGLLDR